jgi:hypothetical protein
MDNSVLTVDVLAGLAGTLLSLAFNYIPGLREKYAVLPEIKKSWIMALSLLVATGLVIGASCLDFWVLTPCTKIGIFDVIKLFGIALVTNQSIYKLSPQVASVKALKAVRDTVDYKAAGPVG